MPEKFYRHNFPKPSEDVKLQDDMSPQTRREVIKRVVKNPDLIRDPDIQENFLQSLTDGERYDFYRRFRRDKKIKSLPEKTKEDILAQRQTVRLPEAGAWPKRSPVIKAERVNMKALEFLSLREKIKKDGMQTVRVDAVETALNAIERYIKDQQRHSGAAAINKEAFNEFLDEKKMSYRYELTNDIMFDFITSAKEFTLYVNEQLELLDVPEIQQRVQLLNMVARLYEEENRAPDLNEEDTHINGQ